MQRPFSPRDGRAQHPDDWRQHLHVRLRLRPLRERYAGRADGGGG
eukprot:SAG31_NODE_452_length_15484_cov_20.883198_2_plen_45_part_00